MNEDLLQKLYLNVKKHSHLFDKFSHSFSSLINDAHSSINLAFSFNAVHAASLSFI